MAAVAVEAVALIVTAARSAMAVAVVAAALMLRKFFLPMILPQAPTPRLEPAVRLARAPLSVVTTAVLAAEAAPVVSRVLLAVVVQSMFRPLVAAEVAVVETRPAVVEAVEAARPLPAVQLQLPVPQLVLVEVH
jgi:hypothetical protein